MGPLSADIIASHSGQLLKPFDPTSESRLKLQFSTRRKRDRIDFGFLLSGGRASDLNRVVIPEVLAKRERQRRHELWKKTCLEIFIAPSDQSQYFELNLSPTGDWNLYAFDSYRSGMREARHASTPELECEWTTDRDSVFWNGSLLVEANDIASSTGSEIIDLLRAPSLVMGATAVLEYANGEKEYWAIAHAGEKPDFHLRESFRLVL